AHDDGKIEIWAPSQFPQQGQMNLVQQFGLKPEQVKIHLTRMGGGFGRRLMNDYMVQAVAIAQKKPGVPIQLIWSREDDLRGDFFRPAGYHKFRAALDADGKFTALDGHFVTFGRGERLHSSAEMEPT